MSRAFRSAQQQSSSIQSSIHRLPTCTEMGETAVEMCLVGNTPSFYSPAKRTTTESFYPTFSLSLSLYYYYIPPPLLLTLSRFSPNLETIDWNQWVPNSGCSNHSATGAISPLCLQIYLWKEKREAGKGHAGDEAPLRGLGRRHNLLSYDSDRGGEEEEKEMLLAAGGWFRL